jgi:integrase
MGTVTLRVAHRKDCANATKTAFDSLHGCTCKPSYYTFHRDRTGRPIKGTRLRDRRVAERARTALQADLDAGRVGIRQERNITFDEWADTWLEQHTARPSTLGLYKHTVSVAKKAFGPMSLREIEASDIRNFFDLLRNEAEDRKRPITSTTLARHYRTLHSCLAAAVPEYATINPATLLNRSFRPKADSERWDYFTDDELARLWRSFERRKDTLGLYLAKAAVTTGLRIGEIAALTRKDVDLRARTLSVREAYRTEVGVSLPKSGKARTVHLTEDAAAVLRDWLELRSPDLFNPDALLFANSAGGHVDRANVTKRMLYPAMRDAQPAERKRSKKGEWGIPRVGERGNPRSFHSFRHTFARLVLEAGGDRFWLQQQLGHSTAAMTERYSMWSRAAEQAQAAAFAVGAFRV